MTSLANRVLAFRSLGEEGFNLERAMRSPERFPGYSPEDSLDLESINRMSPREVASFRDTLVSLGELSRLSPQDVERFQRRVDDLQQNNHHRGRNLRLIGGN